MEAHVQHDRVIDATGLEQLQASRRMLTHLVKLLVRQTPGFVQDGGGNGHLADIVQQPRIACLAYLVRWQVELACQDRKSTRLNSSHLVTSDAVICLKTT